MSETMEPGVSIIDEFKTSLDADGLSLESQNGQSLFRCLAKPLQVPPAVFQRVMATYGTNHSTDPNGVHYGQRLPGDDSTTVKWNAWLGSLSDNSMVPQWFLHLVAEKFKYHFTLYQRGAASPEQFGSEKYPKHLSIGFVDDVGYFTLRQKVLCVDLNSMVCELHTNLTQNVKSERERIVQVMVALLNTNGGKIIIHHSGSTQSNYKQTQNWVNRMEDFIFGETKDRKIPDNIFVNYVKVRASSDSQQLEYDIRQSKQCVTKDYNAFCRTDNRCHKIRDYDTMMTAIRPPEVDTQSGYPQCDDLHYNKAPLEVTDKTLLRENMQCEFKYYDADTLDHLKQRIEQNKNILKKTISAFGNSKGGIIYIGIKELAEHPVVIGHKLDGDIDEQCKNEIIPLLIQCCLWGRGADVAKPPEPWELTVLSVQSDCDNNNGICANGNLCPCKGRRYVIALKINRLHGGVFTGKPICFTLNDQGEVSFHTSLGAWKDNILRLDPNSNFSLASVK